MLYIIIIIQSIIFSRLIENFSEQVIIINIYDYRIIMFIRGVLLININSN